MRERSAPSVVRALLTCLAVCGVLAPCSTAESESSLAVEISATVRTAVVGEPLTGTVRLRVTEYVDPVKVGIRASLLARPVRGAQNDPAVRGGHDLVVLEAGVHAFDLARVLAIVPERSGHHVLTVEVVSLDPVEPLGGTPRCGSVVRVLADAVDADDLDVKLELKGDAWIHKPLRAACVVDLARVPGEGPVDVYVEACLEVGGGALHQQAWFPGVSHRGELKVGMSRWLPLEPTWPGRGTLRIRTMAFHEERVCLGEASVGITVQGEESVRRLQPEGPLLSVGPSPAFPGETLEITLSYVVENGSSSALDEAVFERVVLKGGGKEVDLHKESHVMQVAPGTVRTRRLRLSAPVAEAGFHHVRASLQCDGIGAVVQSTVGVPVRPRRPGGRVEILSIRPHPASLVMKTPLSRPAFVVYVTYRIHPEGRPLGWETSQWVFGPEGQRLAGYAIPERYVRGMPGTEGTTDRELRAVAIAKQGLPGTYRLMVTIGGKDLEVWQRIWTIEFTRGW